MEEFGLISGGKWISAKRGICYACFLQQTRDPNKKFWEESPTFLWYDMDHTENEV
jgi:hypothetical protein